MGSQSVAAPPSAGIGAGLAGAGAGVASGGGAGAGVGGAAGWNAQLHPRGAHGRFAAKGDGYGSDGPSGNVSQLQQRLQQLGFHVTADGKFGPQTEAALAAFQQRYGLPGTGQLDAATLTIMRDPPPETLAQVQADQAAAKASAAKTKAATKKAIKAAGTASKHHSTSTHHSTHHSTSTRIRRATSSARSRTKVGGPGGMGTYTLTKGLGMGKSSEPAVSNLQQALENLGYDVGVDGRFGPQTEQAVKRLQRRYGLHADGRVGADTKALILRLQARTRAQAAAKGPDSVKAITEGLYGGWGAQPSRSIPDHRPEGEPEYDRPIYSQATGAKAEPFTPEDEFNPSVEGDEPYGALDNDGDRPPARPPNYRETGASEGLTGGSTPMCARCTRFDGGSTCLGWGWVVSRTGVCDAYDNLAGRIGVRLQEAVEQRKQATSSREFTAALARERKLRERLQEAVFWSPALHPRDRGGRFSQVMEQLKHLPGGDSMRFGDHTVTKHNTASWSIRGPERTARAESPSKVALHLHEAFGGAIPGGVHMARESPGTPSREAGTREAAMLDAAARMGVSSDTHEVRKLGYSRQPWRLVRKGTPAVQDHRGQGEVWVDAPFDHPSLGTTAITTPLGYERKGDATAALAELDQRKAPPQGRWIATVNHPVHGNTTSPVDAPSSAEAWQRAQALHPQGTVQSVRPFDGVARRLHAREADAEAAAAIAADTGRPKAGETWETKLTGGQYDIASVSPAHVQFVSRRTGQTFVIPHQEFRQGYRRVKGS